MTTRYLRITEVARATGISAERLRLWEKRYGWPSPVRTATDHRMFPHWAVDEVRAVADAIRRGQRIGELIVDGRPLIVDRPHGGDPWRAAVRAAGEQPAAATPSGAAVRAIVLEAIGRRSAGALLEAVHRAPSQVRASDLPAACWLPAMAAVAAARAAGAPAALCAPIERAIAAQAAAATGSTSTEQPLAVVAEDAEADAAVAEVAAAMLRLAGVPARPATSARGVPHCRVAAVARPPREADPACRGRWLLIGRPSLAGIALVGEGEPAAAAAAAASAA